ncbi:hypothetical protein HNQ96_005351 [Aminobacter lissarensis]|uniref:Uncharacterized protein n=1 Tax=Aminobacter carboxidus TaxID=376165 RepID=A0A8E2BE78_9HYPH|nr:hypothetical protein [Aminobacter lissarensis]MBB6469461.1 hypothetical protein [Aminobacter lissarensis]
MRASGRALLAFIAALVACSALAMASGWKHYGNARFQYWIDIPPNFSRLEESENGDGGVSSSSDGTAELSVWGGYLDEGDFAAEIEWRTSQDRGDGWSITYQRQQAKWAVWSGAKGGRIFYERAIPVCDGASAYFRLEYDRKQVKAFDPVISRLVKSLRSGDC